MERCSGKNRGKTEKGGVDLDLEAKNKGFWKS